MQILKFQLEIRSGIHVVKSPGGLYARAVQMQGDKLTIWGEAYPGQDDSEHLFQIIGTGQDISNDWHYRGTVQHQGYVWHVYQAPVS